MHFFYLTTATTAVAVQVEADVGDGLKMGHAYSLLGVGEIAGSDGKPIRLVKCRNPWGFGEWRRI